MYYLDLNERGKRDKGKVTSRPFGKKGREKVSVENEEGKVFPSILCRNICFLEEDNSCKSYLPRYENATQYLSYFKGYFTIKSVSYRMMIILPQS